MAFAGIGEIRLRMGDLTGAAAAFAKAEELDVSALPGRARLELLRGRPADAAALINAALAGRTWDRLDRTRLLPDQVRGYCRHGAPAAAGHCPRHHVGDRRADRPVMASDAALSPRSTRGRGADPAAHGPRWDLPVAVRDRNQQRGPDCTPRR